MTIYSVLPAARTRPAVVELNDVIRDMQPMLRRLVPDSVSLHLALTSLCTQVRADSAELEQVLLHVVVNARDAMPRGGKISLTTWRSTTRHVVLSVTDRGCGMDPATRACIVDRCFPSAGTGLSIVHAIADRHGATISVSSVLGAGTKLSMSFPVVDA
ncbi:MAG TPA: ATP-binding protein [Kofleriaceae bacterium]